MVWFEVSSERLEKWWADLAIPGLESSLLSTTLSLLFTRTEKDEEIYCISMVIRQRFSFQNNPNNLDPSYKMDLDLWDCFGRVKLVL